MKTIIEQAVKNSSLNRANRILVAVSGGVDSVVLATVLYKLSYPIALAHCNFKLRGHSADADQAFVEGLAKEWNIPFHTINFNTQQYANSKKVSIQMAARELRYMWFNKLCSQNQYQQIAVGTHLTDSIETFIFNATKGSGIAGLRGIKSNNGNIIRPFLKVDKQQICDYAYSQNIKFREDKSNTSIKYARNKIRHKVLPILSEINPNISETFARNFEKLQHTEAFLHSQLQKIWTQMAHGAENKITINKNDLANHYFADLILQFGLKRFGFTDTQLNNALNSLRVGAEFKSASHTLLIERENMLVYQTPKSINKNQYLIREFLGEIKQPIQLIFKDDFVHDVKITKAKNHAYFDFDQLTFPLMLRTWKAGDKMTPFGMKGTKKVSDILTDAKMPSHQKENTYVLLNNNTVIWVIGIRASEQFKVTPQTKRIYAIEYTTIVAS